MKFCAADFPHLQVTICTYSGLQIITVLLLLLLLVLLLLLLFSLHEPSKKT